MPKLPPPPGKQTPDDIRTLPLRLSTSDPHVLVAACVRRLVFHPLHTGRVRLAAFEVLLHRVADEVPDVVELGPEDANPEPEMLCLEPHQFKALVHALPAPLHWPMEARDPLRPWARGHELLLDPG